eukprot:9271084-Lingulodinium_polyedra.AAC.1
MGQATQQQQQPDGASGTQQPPGTQQPLGADAAAVLDPSADATIETTAAATKTATKPRVRPIQVGA